MVWIEKSVMRVTDRHPRGLSSDAEQCSQVTVFYPYRTLMIDNFSCIPFDLPHLIFEVKLLFYSILSHNLGRSSGHHR